MAPPSPSPRSTAMSEKKTKKQKQRENAGNSGASISTTAAPSLSSKKRKKRPSEPEDVRASELKESKPKKTKEHTARNHPKDQGETRGTDGGGDGAAEGGRRKRVTDPRFASVHTDPRFQWMPRRHTKIAIDSRFAGAFEDERFALSTAPVDKRGKARKGKRQNPLLHYYVQEEEVPSGLGGSREDAARDRLKSLRSDEEDGESGTDKSDSVSTSSSSSEDEDDDRDDDQYSVGSDVAHYLMGSHEDNQTEEATRRLAVVNMDWDHIKAEFLCL